MRNLCSTWPLSITSKVLAFARSSHHTRALVNLRLASATLLSVDAIKALNPQSPQARAIFNLGIVTAIVMTVIFAVVVGIVVYALLRFPRWREGERDPEQGRGNKTIEIVWTAIPLAIVAVLFALAARTMGHLGSAATAEAGHCGDRPSMVVGSALHELGHRRSE